MKAFLISSGQNVKFFFKTECVCVTFHYGNPSNVTITCGDIDCLNYPEIDVTDIFYNQVLEMSIAYKKLNNELDIFNSIYSEILSDLKNQ